MLTVIFDPQELVKSILKIGEEVEAIRDAAKDADPSMDEVNEATDIAAGSCDLLAHELADGKVIGSYIKFQFNHGKKEEGKEDGDNES
jgi:hypothetical protein